MKLMITLMYLNEKQIVEQQYRNISGCDLSLGYRLALVVLVGL
jgi:hypothetical protein